MLLTWPARPSAGPVRTARRDAVLWLALAALIAYPLLWGTTGLTGWTATLWFWSSFVVGFREEYFYRRLVQNELESRLGTIKAVLFTSVVFTVYHVYFFLWGYWIDVAEVFLFSLAIGAIYAATRSFWLAALFHGVYDAVPMVTPFQLKLTPYLGLGLLVIGVVLAMIFWSIQKPRSGQDSQG